MTSGNLISSNVQINCIKNQPASKACHTDEEWIRNGNQVIPPKFLNKAPENLFARSLRRCLICPSSALIHREVFSEIGLFDESLPVCEDYDFWLRLLLLQPPELVDQKLVIKHGGHPGQLSTPTWGMDRFRVKSMEKLLSTPGLVTSEGMKYGKRFAKNAKFSRTVSPRGTNRKKPVSIPEKKKSIFPCSTK